MILGLGNDIVEIERIRKIMKRYPERFINRVFTKQEQDYCRKRKDPAIHFAGRFAAKESLVKALGTGFSQGLNWNDFEILPNESGKPMVYLSPSAEELLGNPSLLVSISHCKNYATCVAIWICAKQNLS
jgi:holo-[acyl-carrier protein] synthase